MLICFEGMDGVGKSSISSKVSQKLNIPLIEKPIKKLLGLSPEQSREISNRLYDSYSSNVQALYYLMGYLTSLEDSKKSTLLMDRGILSTYYFSYNQENSVLFDTFINNYGTPDITFLLYASIDERIRRIKSRNGVDKDLKKDRLYTDDYSKYFEAINRYNIPYLLINTEKLSEEEVIEIIHKIIYAINNYGVNNDAFTDIFSIENMQYVQDMSFEEIDTIIDSRIKKQLGISKKIKR